MEMNKKNEEGRTMNEETSILRPMNLIHFLFFILHF